MFEDSQVDQLEADGTSCQNKLINKLINLTVLSNRGGTIPDASANDVCKASTLSN